MIKLPEPYDQILRFEGSIGLKPGPAVFVKVFTADQLKQAIRDALEEAAKIFDGEGEEAYSYHAAERIRKLKEDIQ